jgi:hypothetical protein
MPGLVPGIHVFGMRQDVDGRIKPGHDVVDFVRAEKLPIDAVPVQRADDACPDPVAHAVRSRAPRHHCSSPGRRSSGSGARRASSVPLHPGRSRPGPSVVARLRPGRLSPCRLSPARLRLGLDDRRPLDIFRSFRRLRDFSSSRSLGRLGRSAYLCGLAATERQASITSLSRGGGQNKSCNENEFTHVCVSP